MPFLYLTPLYIVFSPPGILSPTLFTWQPLLILQNEFIHHFLFVAFLDFPLSSNLYSEE